MRSEPGSEVSILREDNALLGARVQALTKELETAVRYCSKQYWADGHADRVRDTYGLEIGETQ